MNCFSIDQQNHSTPIVVLELIQWQEWLDQQSGYIQSWINAQHIKAKSGVSILVPNEKGELSSVVFLLENKNCFWEYAQVVKQLPEGSYQFENLLAEQYDNAAIAWGLENYRFDQFKSGEKAALTKTLFLPEAIANREWIENYVAAHCYTRDLVNRPANDLNPETLALEAKQLAKKYEGHCHLVIGEDLLEDNYPLVYAVGKASTVAPRLIDLTWGKAADPKITLVGKGVCFDNGGLNIKPGNGMALMRKDMGGAANVLGLAKLIMSQNLPVRLRVLVPAVENAIAGNAMRPGDIYPSRKGLSVEITNTDAEGRLILADALTEASAEKPELLIDMATLTGAARVALGTDVPAVMTNRDELAKSLMKTAMQQHETLWQLPLYQEYKKQIETPYADLKNCCDSGYAGTITAGLFLQSFVEPEVSWMHIDLMAWNLSSRPGRPQGGEAMGLRALFAYIKDFVA